MSKICLLVLCGLPASGKTTFAKSLKKFLHEIIGHGWLPVHINYDELLPSSAEENLFEKEGYENLILGWKFYRLSILKCIESLIRYLQKGSNQDIAIELNLGVSDSQIDSSLSDRHKNLYFLQSMFIQKVVRSINDIPCGGAHRWVFIIDDNMWLQSMRYQVCQVARKYRCSFSQLYFSTTLEESMERNKNRTESSRVSENSILRMATKMEAPNPTNAWERYSEVWIDGDFGSNNFEKILDLLNIAADHPCLDPNGVDPIFNESERLATLTSIVHQSDVILRKLVGKWVAVLKEQLHKDDIPNRAKELNSIRSTLLEGLRSGSLFLPSMTEADAMGSIGDEGSELYRYLEGKFENEVRKVLRDGNGFRVIS